MPQPINPAYGSFAAFQRPEPLAEATRSGLMSAMTTLLVWRERTRQRRELAALDDRMLTDLGLTRAAVEDEAGKPFWRS